MARPVVLFPWFSQLRGLRGVGEQRAKQLEGIGLSTFKDAALHFPSSAIDRRERVPLRQAVAHQVLSAIVTVVQHRPPERGRKIYAVDCQNATGRLVLSFFSAKGDYLLKQLPMGKEVAVSGRIEWYNGLPTMPHPDYIVPAAKADEVFVLEPVYPLTAGISNKIMRGIVEGALGQLPALPEWIAPDMILRQGWPGYLEGIKRLHRLDERELHAKAQERLAYDELFANQLAMLLVRRGMQRYRGAVIAAGGELFERFLKALPFALTKGQREVLADIGADMASGERMLRLLQGDVGSGKTAVAVAAMVNVVAAGHQAAMMAPTDIVARQHWQWAEALLGPLGIRCGYLSGAAKPKERKAVLEGLASGEIHLLFGTHALFQEKVEYKNLALVVVDEQHRFGVQQRLAFIEKGNVDGAQPHVLLMSATPIPRSLTMAYFGDMEASRLTEKPPGRTPVVTRALPLSRYVEVAEGLRRAMADGARVYWVCPLVEESEKSDLMAVTDRLAALKQLFGEKVEMVHGRMSAEAKDAAIKRFAAGEVGILVATTVIEVGVNVPEATIIVIEHAERFGLAQLHQLRGRVGRGNKASSCLLLYADDAGRTSRERLKALRDEDDGFVIAEEDLRLRGGGDVLGTKQSGMPAFRFADLFVHRELMHTARDDARLLLNKDPKLESERGKAARVLLHLQEYERMVSYSGAG